MPNIQDYALEIGSTPLEREPFTVLDSLILTQIVYMPFEGLLDEPDSRATIGQAWDFLLEQYPNNLDDRYQKKRYNLTKACAQGQRYRGWVIHDYRNIISDELQTQFAAFAVTLDDGSEYIAFRGTDLTLAGWKEDFNMSFLTPVPAQSMSVHYVEQIFEKTGAPMMLGGHSKGGNLALYSAINVNDATRDQITRVYSFDGPGLDEKAMNKESYRQIQQRVQSVLPRSSVVGMLMSYHPVYTVVRSDTIGILQHDAMTWQVKGDHFDTVDRLDLTGQITDRTLHDWIGGMTAQDRQQLVGSIFKVVDTTNAQTLNELIDDFTQNASLLVTAMRQVDPQLRKSLRSLLRCFLSAGMLGVVRDAMPRLVRITNPLRPLMAAAHKDSAKAEPENPPIK